MQEYNFGSGNIANAILAAIFGQNWQNMLDSGPTSSIGPLLIKIFTIYNSAVAGAVAIIVGYSLFSSTTQTAHEGKALGKRFSSLWMPLRMAFGAALVTPIFGFSLVQMLVLSVTGFGFFTADRIAEEVATYTTDGHALTTFPAFYSKQKDEAILALLQLETCAAYINKSDAIALSPTSVVTPKLDDNTIYYGRKGLFGFDDGSCGTIKTESFYDEAVASMLYNIASKTIRPLAKQIVNDEEVNVALVKSAKEQLYKIDEYLAQRAKNDVDKETSESMSKFSNDVKSKGWIGLGSWYTTLARQTSAFNDKVAYNFSVEIENKDNIVEKDLGGMSEYLVEAVSVARDAGIAIQSEDTQSSMQNAASSIIDLLAGSGDPFLRIVQLGHYCTQTAFVLSSAKLAVSIVSAASGFLGKAGAIVANASDFVQKFDKITDILIILLFIAGGGAGWLLPMLPLITWIFGICSVFVGVLQSVLAAPIWAAAHALPEGEGISGTHARQGYMLVMNLALRPVLITLGFVFSYFLLWGMSWMFLELLKSWFGSQAVDSPGWDALNFFVGLCISLFVAIFGIICIAIRCFSFIFDAADEVLTWIGGHAQLGSDRQSAARAIATIQTAFRAPAGMARSAVGLGNAAQNIKQKYKK